MRAQLATYAGGRHRFRAVFGGYGQYQVPASKQHKARVKHAVLLTDITTPRGELLCDHVWVHDEPNLFALHARRNWRLDFTARVLPYRRVVSGEIEYGLRHLDDIRRY